MEQLGSRWTDFDEIWCLSFFRKSSKKIQFLLKLTGIKGTLHEDVSTLMTVSRFILLGMRIFQGKVAEKIIVHISCSVTFFSENRAVYDIR